MRWPWHKRQETAEREATLAEAELLIAKTDYLHSRDLANQARREAEKSRERHAENGFAQLIRQAMGVHHREG
jgi:hypothetical protein